MSKKNIVSLVFGIVLLTGGLAALFAGMSIGLISGIATILGLGSILATIAGFGILGAIIGLVIAYFGYKMIKTEYPSAIPVIELLIGLSFIIGAIPVASTGFGIIGALLMAVIGVGFLDLGLKTHFIKPVSAVIAKI